MSEAPAAGTGSSCAVCQRPFAQPFLSLSGLPVLCNASWPTREEARLAPRGDIALAFCPACGMIANTAFDEHLVTYTPAYENSLHFSPRFQAHAEELAHRLVETYDLRGKTVVEIGCGKGDFLGLICAVGENHGIGYDPSYEDDRSTDVLVNPHVRFVPRLWDGQLAQADLVCCRHVLEHVSRPSALVGGIAAVIGRRRPAVYFEVPDAAYMLRETAIYDIVYEHCSYFSAAPLRRLFSGHGFDVVTVNASFGGQYLYLECTGGGGTERPAPADEPALSELAEQVSSFGHRSSGALAMWAERLEHLEREGGEVVVWGAGSKGVSFVNMVAGRERVSRLVDMNPRKRGRFVPVSGQEVVAPQDLVGSPPQTVIVMNPMYVEEVRAQLHGLGLAPEILSA
ncbi:MAG: methyltransferase domain-containing protein [Acidimicrobiales bacterium]